MAHPTSLRWFLGLALLSGSTAWAGYLDDVGYTKLQADLSSSLPTGAGVVVSQVEASESSTVVTCLPDPTRSDFSGKNFNNKTGTSNVSGHATTVAGNFYSNTTSMAPGVTSIDVYNASGWLGTDLLRTGNTTKAPLVENSDIENHSWVGNSTTAMNQDALRRLDFAIQRDDFVAVLGLNNGYGNPVPALLGSSYNGITVGLTNGNHSSGTTTEDGAGRSKPDIVAPENFTSFATPQVSAAAALLLSKARSDTSFTLAEHSVVLKALLLAGATKTEFPMWSHTPAQPLDARYGVGQLNIYRSYYDLVAGRQAASTAADVKNRGWDYSTTSSATTCLYFFEVAPDDTASGFSAVLTWNRIVAGRWSATTSTLANLSLKLYQATNFTVGTVVDTSASAVDNVEHIYQPNLPAGRYALEVTSASATATNFGLAWTSLPTVQIVASSPDASEMGAVAGGFTVTRAGDASGALDVFYTVGGAATNGGDYSSISGSVHFAAGETSKNIAVAPLSDTLAEGDESVTLTLVPDLAYGLDSSTAASVTIHDLPFDAWRYAQFTESELADASVSDPASDPDADGLTNLQEYALALDPKVSSTEGLPVTNLVDGTATLTYTQVKSAGDVVYLPEISDDLQTWQSGPDYLTETSRLDNGTTETVTVSATSSSATAQFLRLRITK